MKKFILAVIATLAIAQSAFAYTLPVDWNPDAPCGWDFARSEEIGVPLTYCHAKQDRGDQTFFGLINVACSGSACKPLNSIFN